MSGVETGLLITSILGTGATAAEAARGRKAAKKQEEIADKNARKAQSQEGTNVNPASLRSRRKGPAGFDVNTGALLTPAGGAAGLLGS